MSTHFKWYPAESEVVVPFNARYAFPSQANKAIKMTPRIPPKNAQQFSPGNVIRLEFPAQGYVNPGKTTLEFDVQLLYTPTDTERTTVRFQNNIQSIFSRVRLLYGSTPLEDIPNYNVIVRQLTEWTGSDQLGADQTSVTDGIGGVAPAISGVSLNEKSGTGVGVPIIANVRQKSIQGIDTRTGTVVDAATPSGFGSVPNGPTPLALASKTAIQGTNPTRRYQVQLALGLMTQEKLIPTKFMASQLAIEITLANSSECIYLQAAGTASATLPTYLVSNVNLVPEILEFDASYDESFLRGLQQGGVPIKFSTWNNYRFSNGTSSMVNLQIQERSRSVKAIFCMQRRDPPSIYTDSGASFFNTDVTTLNGASTLQDYQYRIGGRYFPASPVQNSLTVGSNIPNGGCESYTELAKAINTLGDTRLSTAVNSIKWALNPAPVIPVFAPVPVVHPVLPEFDFDQALLGFKPTGAPVLRVTTNTYLAASGAVDAIMVSAAAGDVGSTCFAMAIDLETSNGLEISGLNAEEQSDISLIARFSASQSSGFLYDVFTYIDSMIVLRENNVRFKLKLGIGIDSVNCMFLNKNGYSFEPNLRIR